MNKSLFCRNHFLTDWCHMRRKNAIEISSIYWNVLLWILSNWMETTICVWSSLFYNTTARHKRHEGDTNNMSETRVQQERHECNTNATEVLHKRHECNTSATRTTRVRQEWNILIFITTGLKTCFLTPILSI